MSTKQMEQFVFTEMDMDYDGGCYATFICGACSATFYPGTADYYEIPRKTHTQRIARCPECGAFDKSWRRDVLAHERR